MTAQAPRRGSGAATTSGIVDVKSMTTDESHTVSFRCDDRDYDSWLDVLTEMSVRLDVLQTAVTELRRRCKTEDMHSEHLLEVLDRHGA